MSVEEKVGWRKAGGGKFMKNFILKRLNLLKNLEEILDTNDERK